MQEDFLAGEATAIILDKKQPGFVKTPYVEDLVKWGLYYLRAGFPLHLRGPAGTGKTTLAMHIAAQLGKPVILIHGDEELTTSELVGGMQGFRRRQELDQFIHSVRKFKEEEVPFWIDNRLTTACKRGFTLIYDEFTRAKPEANNVLLSVLEEGVLDLPSSRGEDSYLKVHPDFCAIFTSNPVEYAGTHAAQDALRDRMITINLGHYDRETEIKICMARSGIGRTDAERIVDIVRGFRKTRKDKNSPSVRAAIMIGKVVKLCKAHTRASDPAFFRACFDMLSSEIKMSINDTRQPRVKTKVRELIKKYC